MAESRAAIRYAKAVLDLATQEGVAEQVQSDMKQVTSAILASSELHDMLQSPVIGNSVKKTSLLEVFNGSHSLSFRLMETLIANKRINLLGDVAQKYNELYDKLNGIQVAEVTTAVPLTDELEQKILAKVKELTGKEATIESQIDESILGGFILRVGDIQYNASIANKLNRLKREFTLN